jgi:hypothetical protein
MLVRLDHGVLIAVAAESVTKLHPKLSAPAVTHTVTVKEPPEEAKDGSQLTLT